jgi:hypothetical protein
LEVNDFWKELLEKIPDEKPELSLGSGFDRA